MKMKGDEQLPKGEDLIAWVKNSATLVKEVTYLVDFELMGEPKTGLDLIEELKLTRNASLVAGHQDDSKTPGRTGSAEVDLD